MTSYSNNNSKSKEKSVDEKLDKKLSNNSSILINQTNIPITSTCLENNSINSSKCIETKTKPKSKPKPRCSYCETTLSLLDSITWKCRCEKTFCQKHRMPEAHACTYEFKDKGKRELFKLNPVVVGDRISKIL